jgi:hypothetical protein
VSPDFLRTYRPDVVLVMNQLYVSEIKQSLTDLQLTPEIVTIW